MSCSVGVARHREGQPLADLLRAADEAMYADKRTPALASRSDRS